MISVITWRITKINQSGRPSSLILISGIHDVGVIPEMRRRGFAGEIMKFLLNQAINSEAEYVTLQASNMGKGVYLKLGFKEQFIMKNYKLSVD